MPDLQKSFLHYDHGMLNILAEKWDVELEPGTSKQMLGRLITFITRPGALQDLLNMLPDDTKTALHKLVAAGGTQLWAEFTRNHGDLRIMGSAKRDRERPDRNPVSITEQLFYCGLIAKAFLKSEGEPQEYAFIPDEIHAVLSNTPTFSNPIPGHPAVLPEKQHIMAASSALVDDACTYLAALRAGVDPQQHSNALINTDTPLLSSLLKTSELIDASSMPEPNNVRKFLESTRAESLLFLVQHWQQTHTFNELRLLDHIICEGNWTNSPQPARKLLIDLLQTIPAGTWWDLNSFVEYVKKEKPDFQRPAGDYDSWFIKRTADNQYLRGFSSWDEVEGELVRYLITGPMHLLGLIDLAGENRKAAHAFKWSVWADALLNDRLPPVREPEPGHIRLNTSGTLFIDRTAVRPIRYQMARFCEWQGIKDNSYRYRITPAMFLNAQKQGLQAGQFMALLLKHADPPLPPGILQAVQRWEKDGTAALIQPAVILRLENPEVLEKLQHSRAGRYVVEMLSPTACTIRSGGIEAIRNVLAELGYLADIQVDV